MMNSDGAPEVGRPIMPEGYGLAAAEKFEPIKWEWVEEKLKNSRNYWIATVRKSSRPHVAPVWGLWFDGRVTFGTDPESAKARNANRNPACSIHLESGDDVVILDGELERVTDKDTLQRFNLACVEKYGVDGEPGDASIAVFALNASVVMAWLESDFPNTATRWKFS